MHVAMIGTCVTYVEWDVRGMRGMGRSSEDSDTLLSPLRSGPVCPSPVARASMPLGVFHQVMVRGIERRAVLRDARDRAAFVDRVAARAATTGWTLVA